MELIIACQSCLGITTGFCRPAILVRAAKCEHSVQIMCQIATAVYAPYFASRPALARASVIRYLASNWPRPPRRRRVLAERRVAVGAAAVADQQRRHGMPTVALEVARRAVVAGDDQHRRASGR